MCRKDIMIDLETLSLSSDCVILSIGACEFDIETGKILLSFYSPVNIQNQLNNGRKISESTLQWWIRQVKDNPNAADVFTGHSHPLHSVLSALSAFVPEDARVWSNGTSFDIPILENLRRDIWAYNRSRDARTIMDVAGLSAKDFEFEGTMHNALDDAIHQAKYVSAAWRKLRDIS